MNSSILLLACYELGHQPLSLAWPLATLCEAGFSVQAQDLSLEPLSEPAVAGATLVGIAAPMHTAMRLGVEAAQRVRRINPGAHICFYGHYAWLNADYLLSAQNGDGPLADSVIAGEFEAPLLELARTLETGAEPRTVPGATTAAERQRPNLERFTFPLPARDALPSLERYAHYVENGVSMRAGYVEASRGCLHTCTHCPITPVYRGRFFVVSADVVLADIHQQIAAGARHITFGDPDFLNGPGHALHIAQRLHEEYPAVSFDFTAKVEHLIEHRALLPQLQAFGASFVVSAFEAVNDDVLARLHKGHTVADMDHALDILEEAGLPVQPTWVPFTPWTSLQDYLDLLAWIRTRELIPNTPPVQLSIRLLVPPGSALLEHPAGRQWAGPLDAPNFVHKWRHPDPRMDALQLDVAHLVETAGGDPNPADAALFDAIEQLAHRYAGRSAPSHTPSRIACEPPPRLTEDWFC